jgi:RHS repeat-associated protein
MTLEYMMGDHLGSTSLTTDTNGVKISELRYKPWGETRYEWTDAPATTPTYELTKYQYTGQYSYDTEFGLKFYGARFYDSEIGHFVSADTVIPTGTQGTQAWDRYAYTNNNPVRYNDPSGHCLFVCTILAGAAIGAVVSMAVQGVAIATGKQESMNWGAVTGAAMAGAFFGGAVFLAPAGLGVIGTGVVGALAGAASGRVGIFTEAVVNEAINDGSNYNPADVGQSALEDGFMDPGQMALDAAGGATSLIGGQALTKAAANVGLLPETTIARGAPMVVGKYGGGWTVVQRQIVGPTIAPSKLISTVTYTVIEAIEDLVQQTAGGHSAE